jgi:hypothetical protein
VHEDIVYVNPFTTRYEDIPSPTPKEEKKLQVADASSNRKVKQRKSKEINKLRKKLAQQEFI